MKLPTAKTAKAALKGALLIAVSLIAGLVVRFVWVKWAGKAHGSTSYWNYVDTSLSAFLDTLFPSLLIGLGVFLVYSKLSAGRKDSHRFPLSILSLTAFFALLACWGEIFDVRAPLGPISLVAAWLFALLTFSVTSVSSRTDQRLRQRIVSSRTAQRLIDAAVVGLAFGIAYLIRFDGDIPGYYRNQLFILFPYVVVFQILLNQLWGIYSFLWRFTSLRESLIAGLSIGCATLVLLVLRIAVLAPYDLLRVPFGVLFIHPVLTYIGFLGARTARRIQFGYFTQRKGVQNRNGSRPRALLVGAGEAGQLLLRELRNNASMEVIGFLDDDPRKIRSVIHGVRVLGSTDDIVRIIRENNVEEVVLSMPAAPRSVFRKILSRCGELDVRTSSIPNLSEIVQGKVSINQLHAVHMEDLLGRDSIKYVDGDPALMESYQAKRILITGAAGSIGSELVRQLREFQPASLLLLDKDENGLFEIGLEIREDYEGELLELVADIRNQDRLKRIFAAHRPTVIFHAAAFKHVPMMELHPGEAILNNVFGTKGLVELACEHNVESFVMISTDKAVNPTNVMGASKRVAELVVQRQASQGGETRLCCVRFGNVLGSRGSVVPLFQKQIAQGRDLTVTHPEVRRYFMSIPEAVQLVIQAGSLGQKGEIFVLDMGEPIRIVDLAQELIERSGLVLGQDIGIEYTGLRPGEKLFEEILIRDEDGTRHTRYPKIFVAQALKPDWPELAPALEKLKNAADAEDFPGIYSSLERLGIGYRHQTKHVSR